YQKLYDIDTNYINGGGGEIIEGILCEAPNGKLYGMTGYGGINDHGVIYEFDLTNNSYSKKIDFDGPVTGRYSRGGLTIANNGKLYGMQFEGGMHGGGTLFQYDPAANAVTDLFDFDTPTGYEPFGNNVYQAGNGRLYGTTPIGGSSYDGTLFEYDLSNNIFIKKAEFNDTTTWPISSMIESYPGVLFGMTE